MKCINCRYWKAPGTGENHAGSGECRKSPPLVIVTQGTGLVRGQVAIGFRSYWPPVVATEWCGAFEVQHPTQ